MAEDGDALANNSALPAIPLFLSESREGRSNRGQGRRRYWHTLLGPAPTVENGSGFPTGCVVQPRKLSWRRSENVAEVCRPFLEAPRHQLQA